MELLIIPTLALVAYLWWVHRAFDSERKRWEAERTNLLKQQLQLVEAAAQERSSLLNRIQAPEVEVAKQWAVEDPGYVSFDNDEEFNTYKQELTNGG